MQLKTGTYSRFGKRSCQPRIGRMNRSGLLTIAGSKRNSRIMQSLCIVDQSALQKRLHATQRATSQPSSACLHFRELDNLCHDQATQLTPSQSCQNNSKQTGVETQKPFGFCCAPPESRRCFQRGRQSAARHASPQSSAGSRRSRP